MKPLTKRRFDEHTEFKVINKSKSVELVAKIECAKLLLKNHFDIERILRENKVLSKC